MMPSIKPLVDGLGWKIIQELNESETEAMIFKSLNGLALQ